MREAMGLTTVEPARTCLPDRSRTMNLPLDLVPIDTGPPLDARAHLRRAPARNCPKDLYIPPDALQVFPKPSRGRWTCCLPDPQGQPRHPDVDGAISPQYLEYVEAMRATNLGELAAEYLLMAAVLLEIKSRMLLPRPPREVRKKTRAPSWCAGCSNTNR